jgi:hypothetical protein
MVQPVMNYDVIYEVIMRRVKASMEPSHILVLEKQYN